MISQLATAAAILLVLLVNGPDAAAVAPQQQILKARDAHTHEPLATRSQAAMDHHQQQLGRRAADARALAMPAPAPAPAPAAAAETAPIAIATADPAVSACPAPTTCRDHDVEGNPETYKGKHFTVTKKDCCAYWSKAGCNPQPKNC